MIQKDMFMELKELAKEINIDLTEKQVNQFRTYKNEIIKWNEQVNLTAITEEKEFLIKHFIDSLTIQKYIQANSKIIDIGTGAGFPGIPLKIVDSSLYITLLDSLNKRLKILDEIIENLGLDSISTLHGRAEEIARCKNERETYDYAVSRAVAPLNVLAEYLLPFVKVGGKCICMKGSNGREELKEAEKAIKILGGIVEKVEEITLPKTDMKRVIIVLKKQKETPKQYPRKAGTPSKNPIS